MLLVWFKMLAVRYNFQVWSWIPMLDMTVPTEPHKDPTSKISPSEETPTITNHGCSRCCWAVASLELCQPRLTSMGNYDQTGRCYTLPAFEIILSNIDYYVPPNRGYYGCLLSISLAGTTMVACYLAKLQLPTDESHCIRNREWKVRTSRLVWSVGGNVRTLFLNKIRATGLRTIHFLSVHIFMIGTLHLWELSIMICVWMDAVFNLWRRNRQRA